VSDVISEVVLGPFWLRLPGLGPNCKAKVFRRSLYRKLGSSPSLAASFELLTGSVAFAGLEKFPHEATCISVFFSLKSPISARRQSVIFFSPYCFHYIVVLLLYSYFREMCAFV